MAKPNLSDFKHIAVIQTAFLGDVVLAMPLVQVIKNNYPDIKVSVVSTPLATGISSSVKAVDGIIAYDKRGIRRGLNGIKFIASYLREKEVDCIISSHRSLRTSLLTYFAKPRFSVGFNTSALSFLYKKRAKYVKFAHEIERNLNLLKVFADYDKLNLDYKDIPLWISDDDKSYVESLIMSKGLEDDKLVALAPGSIWETKKWKEQHFVRLSEMLIEAGMSPVIVGSETDKDLCLRIADLSGAISLAGEFTLPQFIYFLTLVKLIITNDSAPTHFAGLVDCPTVTLFGPTSPAFGFSPWSSKNVSVELEGLKCKPCEIHGGMKCPIGTQECMANLVPETVFEKAMLLLN